MRILIAPQPLELAQSHERKRCVVKARGPTVWLRRTMARMVG